MEKGPVPAWISIPNPNPDKTPFWKTEEWKKDIQNNPSTSFHHLKRTVLREEFPSLRSYQKELVEKAQQVKNNVILVAPTGSGKTFVAVSLIRDALEKFPQKKIIFLCPTIPLVNQQAEVVERYIDEKYKVGAYSGTLGWVDDFAKNINVLVMTPQIFYDACPDQNTTQDILEAIHLIIFDECHRTTKDYSYNKIMKDIYSPYHDFAKLQSNPQIPVIVGLTASPAAKQTTALTMLETLKLCNNLKATIRIVEEFKEDLKDAVNSPEFVIRKVEMDSSSYAVSKVILDLYNRLKDLFDENDTDLPTVKYLLSKCNESLIILDNRSCRHAWNFFFDFSDRDEKELDNIQEFLTDQGFFSSRFPEEDLPSITNKHKALLNILKEEYNKQINLKTIIFVRSVEDGNHMLNFLNQNLPEIAVTELYGHSEMTVQQQLTQVKEFSAKGNVMIATSVAEEGLDIESCNITVRMHSIHTALEMIQSRGRARYKGGKFYCLYHENSYELFKAESLHFQEQKMERSIKAICYLESKGINISELTDFSNCFDLVTNYFEKEHKELEDYSTAKIKFDELIANQLLINTYSKLFGLNNVPYKELLHQSTTTPSYFQYAVELPNGKCFPEGSICLNKKKAKADAAMNAVKYLLKYDLICPFTQQKKFFETESKLTTSTSESSLDGQSSNSLESTSRNTSSSSLSSYTPAPKSKGTNVFASSILNDSNAKNILMFFVQTHNLSNPEYIERFKMPFVVEVVIRNPDGNVWLQEVGEQKPKKIDAEKTAAKKAVERIIQNMNDFYVSSKLKLV